jgi:UDP-N-acetylglucosamine 2-epimerase (non-hydrolysing)
MKIAPIIRAIDKHNNTPCSAPLAIHYLLVHTGQHYDYEMSQVFFQDLELPRPDIYLGVGSGTHAEQTGKVMIEFEKVISKERPDLVVVVGDVNSTLACALAAVKLHIPVAHVEAGLRSFDRTMPEEINRLLTDAISEYLFTPSPDADENLKKEGIPVDKIFLVGNVMVDSLLFNLEKAKNSPILEKLCLKIDFQSSIANQQSTIPFALLTLHRPSNVDKKETLLGIINALTEISKRLPIVFPAHPRTRKRLADFGLDNPQSAIRNLQLIDPLSYLDFLNLMSHAKLVLTDSGGIQEETTVLGIPCITLRDTTERPITLAQGTNVLAGNDTQRIAKEALKALDGQGKKGNSPELWDGHTAERIVKIFAEEITEK